MRWTPLRHAATITAAAALALSAPMAASAHDSLSSSTPAAGATVSAVSDVAVTLSEPVLALGADQHATAIQVRRDGRFYETACPALSGTTVTVPVSLGAGGEYEVVWQVVSVDGHSVSGRYAFTYAPATGASPAQGSADPPCGSAAAASGPGDDAILIGAAIGVVALAAVGVLAALLLSRRRTRRAPGLHTEMPSPQSRE